MLNRVVVTGIGVVSPIGCGKDRFAEGIFEGASGVGRITRFDPALYSTAIAAEVKDFCPEGIIPGSLLDHTDRFAHFALAAAKEAVYDAGLLAEREALAGAGVLVGTGRGGFSAIEDFYRLMREGAEHLNGKPYFARYLPGSAAAAIALMLGAKGPVNTVMAACASGAVAIGSAYRLLQRGGASIIFAGGCDAPLSPGLFAGVCATRAMSARNGEPRRASRPFDRDRDGFVMGEGAGIVALETLEHAQCRGARVYGEIAGYGENSDAFHVTAPLPGGEGLARAMSDALKESGLSGGAIDYLNAHGTSTVVNDICETQAIRKVFGPCADRLAVSSTKSMTGHLLGAAGAVEFIACLLAMEEDLIPPTINLENPDPLCDLDYVPNRARKKALNAVMSNSAGFGGHNACLVIKSVEGFKSANKVENNNFLAGNVDYLQK